MPGTIFRITLTATQLVLNLPTTKNRRSRNSPSLALNSLGNLGVMVTNIANAKVGNFGLIRKIFLAALVVNHIILLIASAVAKTNTVCRKQNHSLDMHLTHIRNTLIAISKQRAHHPSMHTKFSQRRMIMLTPLRIPLAPKHLNITPNPLNIHQINRMRGHNGNINLKNLRTLRKLKVMENTPAIRKVIPKKGNSLNLSLINRLAYRSNLSHG